MTQLKIEKGYEDNKLLSQEHKFLFSKKAMKVSFEPNTSVAVMQYLSKTLRQMRLFTYTYQDVIWNACLF